MINTNSDNLSEAAYSYDDKFSAIGLAEAVKHTVLAQLKP